jgi:hypothetical protein
MLPGRMAEWAEQIRGRKPERAAEIDALLQQPPAGRDWAELERLAFVAIGAVTVDAFEAELQAAADEIDGREPGRSRAGRLTAPCPRCGRREWARRLREQPRRLTTTLGKVTIVRTEYICSSCGDTFAPFDAALGLRDRQQMSPRMRELSEKYGAESESFEAAHRLLADWTDNGVAPRSSAIRDHLVAGATQLDAAAAQQTRAIRQNPTAPELRLPIAGDATDTLIIEIDGGTVPVRGDNKAGATKASAPASASAPTPTPAPQSQPKTDSGATAAPAPRGDHWREAKLAAIYLDRDRVVSEPSEMERKKGLPGRARVRRCLEVARIGHWDASGFAAEVYAKAVQLGLHRVRRVVVIGDGAEWIAALQQAYFPGAIRILDFWHALERICEPARLAFGEDEAAAKRWRIARHRELMRGNIDAVRSALTSLASGRRIACRRRAIEASVREQQAYLTKRRAQLKPAVHRRDGLPIGSGLIEGRIKTVIQTRARRPGMRWSLEGIQSILRMRTHLRNKAARAETPTKAAA